MSKRFPQFPFFAEDYLSGCRTACMTPEQMGLYSGFICLNWMMSGPLEANAEKLKGGLGFDVRTIKRLVPALIRMGKISIGGGMIWQERTQADVMKFQGDAARPAPPADADIEAAILAAFGGKSAGSPADLPEMSAGDQPDISENSAGHLGDNSKNPSDNKRSSRHTRASTSTSTSTSKNPTATVSLEAARGQQGAGSGPERANLFDAGEPGAHVNCTVVIARYGDGHEIKIPKTIIHDTGRRMSIGQSRAELLAQRVLDGWIADDWRPDRPSDALRRAMAKRAGEPEAIAVVAPRFDELAPTGPGLPIPVEVGGIEYD